MVRIKSVTKSPYQASGRDWGHGPKTVENVHLPRRLRATSPGRDQKAGGGGGGGGFRRGGGGGGGNGATVRRPWRTAVSLLFRTPAMAGFEWEATARRPWRTWILQGRQNGSAKASMGPRPEDHVENFTMSRLA